MPAAFAAEQERLERLRANLPGGQMKREDWRRPNDGPGINKPEVVNYTLAGNGRIRKIVS
jgi:hypothetical protein